MDLYCLVDFIPVTSIRMRFSLGCYDMAARMQNTYLFEMQRKFRSIYADKIQPI